MSEVSSEIGGRAGEVAGVMEVSGPCRSERQSHFFCQTFLRRQTYLLKGLLRDKGGDGVAGCRETVIRRWWLEQVESADWVEAQFEALVQTYETLLAEPRVANLKRMKPRGKAPQLVWRMPNEAGNQVVVALFDREREDCQAMLGRLPSPVLAALLEVEAWRVTLNYLATLQQWVSSTGQECLEQLDGLAAWRGLVSHETRGSLESWNEAEAAS